MSHTLLDATVASITPVDEEARAAAQARQLDLTKPPGSLGRLEVVGNQLAAIAGQCPPPFPARAAVALFAGDHGVHAQGISPWPQEVTLQMAANICAGGAAISVLSKEFGADIVVTDVGVAGDTSGVPSIRQAKLRPGTADLSVEAAMTRDEALAAIEAGIRIVDDLVADGVDLILTGDMGIGNTTVSAAIIAAVTGKKAVDVVGSGAGAPDEMVARKVDVVQRALDLHACPADDALRILECLGGLEHAAIAGSILGAAKHKIPVIIDGVIASSAALIAHGVAPASTGYMIAGHLGVEPGIAAAQEILQIQPLVDLDLRLGEGSGAIMALPAVRAAARILQDMATFKEASVHESKC